MAKKANNQQPTLLKTKPNKAKVHIGKISISAAKIKGYGKKAKIHDERYSKQSQTKPIAENRYKTKDPRHKTKNTSLVINPMLPLCKTGNVQYYSRHNLKVKLSKISIVSILIKEKLAKYRWKILPAAAIFNPIKKLTIGQTNANLKSQRIIESQSAVWFLFWIWGTVHRMAKPRSCFWEIEKWSLTTKEN